MKKAVIYARYSSSNQREESIEGQIRVCKEFAIKEGYTIVGEYIDRALSARTDNRPQFLQMIEDSDLTQFSYVLVYQLDRFSRNRYDSAIYKHKLKKNGVSVISAKENITDDASGVLLEALLEGMAEYYSKELSQKIKRGRKENALNGKWVSGTIPLGFKLTEEKKLVIDKEKAIIIKMIFDLYTKGENLVDITKKLNDMGYRTVKGNKFNRSSLHSILSNEKYIGNYNIAGTVQKGVIEPIIDKETFMLAQKRVELQKHSLKGIRKKTKYLLAGKLFCGNCQQQYNGNSATGKLGKKYFYYYCPHNCHIKRIKKEYIETLVFEKIMALLGNTEMIEHIVDQATQYFAQKEENGKILTLKSKIKELNKRIENLNKSLEISVTEIAVKRIVEMEKELKATETALNTEIILSKPIIITKEHLQFFLYSLLATKKDEQMEKIFQIFVKKVFIYNDKVDLYLNLLPNSSFECSDNCLNGGVKRHLNENVALQERYIVLSTQWCVKKRTF